MTGFSIRPADPADEKAVTTLLQASYGALMLAGYDQTVLADLLPIMARANPGLLSSGTYYLAETDTSDIVGAGGWTRERPGTGDILPGTGHIRHFGTHPDWIGRAVGKSLYKRCDIDARSVGIKRFECYASLNAVDFYARLGFKVIDRIDIPMGEDLVVPSIWMEREL